MISGKSERDIPPINDRSHRDLSWLVGGLLAIMMVVYEIFSAGFTTLRSIQALNVNGPWGEQKGGFMYLLFEQGTSSLDIYASLFGFIGNRCIILLVLLKTFDT